MSTAALTSPTAAPAAALAAPGVGPWQRLLAVDVETDPAHGMRIFRIGALRSDGQASVDLAPRGLPAGAVAAALDRLADGAQVLVGHHLRGHDRPELARQFPGLRLLELPVLDTLELSAFAFPTHPYHRLVKGYKLLSDSHNDPVKDARLALSLLADEVKALSDMQRRDPPWLALLHHLTQGDRVLDSLLATLRGAPAVPAAQAQAIAIDRFAPLCCAVALRQLAASGFGADHGQRLAAAYALGWVRVAGGNSVLPAWVHHAHPAVRTRVAELRERDCADPGCAYCSQQHRPEALLQRWFDKPGFRATPAAADGGSLQRAIVVAALQRQSLLAVLPTGGGKSICYQLPALARYWRSGQLTVIVSPLQSLMKDQVDNLVAAGIHSAVAINGLLTSLERRAALDKVRLGDAGIVLVSPEQFRSRSFAEAIAQREIATWVFDEAHCLSKWGHDFRTDYLYVARFIAEHFGHQAASVACYTATAKPEVIADLCAHFQQQLGITLQRFLGGHERANLSYAVLAAAQADKPQRIVELLRAELAGGGAAVIFCATRRTAQTLAELVSGAGIACGCFHGGLTPEQKKDIQERFLGGGLTVIAATNAFGMGVDKPDIRLVVHADIPGSLENYLQEAGRAGRDGHSARCVLLFDEADVETQFRLAALSQLTPRDFNGLLKGLRARVKRLRSDDIVVSARELLLDAEDTGIDGDRADAGTKVTTAIAWLERSGYLRREENATRVYPTSLRVPSLVEAMKRLLAADLVSAVRKRLFKVARALFRSVGPTGMSTDDLMLEAGIAPDECFRSLHALEQLGILANDLGLTVRVAKGVVGASAQALAHLAAMEEQLIALLREQAPDADAGSAPQQLSVRAVCTALRRRMALPDGDQRVSPAALRNCLRSMAENFGSQQGKRRMLQLRGLGPDALQVVLQRPWSQVREICERRRAVARVVLERLLHALPDGARNASLIVECKAQELLDAMAADLDLRATLKEPALALEHALLYLHENRVIELDKGRSVFRSAMTLKTDPQALKRRFNAADFAPLQQHYRERTLQTHVMHEYARLGATNPRRAQALVQAYFSAGRSAFLREFFRGRADLLELATTDESFRRIVDDLNHPVQQALVEASERGNQLVLAGPGSGKTRVIVHRIAYLLRVRRVAAQRIIALAYNRKAAAQLRQRLLALAGDDARAVTVLTYHALALRLTGTSLAAAQGGGQAVDFTKLLQDAVDLLDGKTDGVAAADEWRDRLLQRYEYIFVDEYQDVNAAQYALISALAGRQRADPTSKLSVMAVGDDDQNIYAFNGANVEFIRRFQADYDGAVTYLVENFRSTQHIISAANHVVQRCAQRMKIDHPIRINAGRASDPAGGDWGQRQADLGRVQLLTTPSDANRQAQVVGQEIHRLLQGDPAATPGDIAVLSRRHAALHPLRALCEAQGLRCEHLGADAARAQINLMHSREGDRLAQLLATRRQRLLRLAALQRWLRRQQCTEGGNPWWDDLAAVLAEHAQGCATERTSAAEVLDALYDAAHEFERSGHPLALKLMTAHAAKGLEFAHVIVLDCGDWALDNDADRRLLYVAMTRARQSLTLCRAEDRANPYLMDLATLSAVQPRWPQSRPEPQPALDVHYHGLGPRDVVLSFVGSCAPEAPIHRHIAALRAGDTIYMRGRELRSAAGHCLGRLAAAAPDLGNAERSALVTAILVRRREMEAEEFHDRVRCARWEVVLAEVKLGQPDGTR